MFGGEDAALVVDHQRLINPAQDVREILRSHADYDPLALMAFAMAAAIAAPASALINVPSADFGL